MALSVSLYGLEKKIEGFVVGGCNQCEEYEKQRIKLKTAHNPCTILT
jgi:hypothetical protein